MKLQVVGLPEVRVGDAVEAPFLLVLSEVESFDSVSEAAVGLKENIGARGVLLFEDPVEVVPRASQ